MRVATFMTAMMLSACGASGEQAADVKNERQSPPAVQSRPDAPAPSPQAAQALVEAWLVGAVPSDGTHWCSDMDETAFAARVAALDDFVPSVPEGLVSDDGTQTSVSFQLLDAEDARRVVTDGGARVATDAVGEACIASIAFQLPPVPLAR